MYLSFVSFLLCILCVEPFHPMFLLLIFGIITTVSFLKDTEFPGVVAKPICEFGASDFTYQVSEHFKFS